MSWPLPRPGTHAARILAELGRRPDGASDAELAKALVLRHEIVNSNCRLLNTQGLIVREKRHGVIINQVLLPEQTASPDVSAYESTENLGIGSPSFALPNDDLAVEHPRGGERHELAVAQAAKQPWFWEGNVQSTVAAFLELEGWSILRSANTQTREPGKDIEAMRGGAILWVTVKGRPVVHPSAQARVWFADAMLDVIRYRQEHAAALIAVALPEFEKYHTWRERTAWLQRTAPFDYLWVGEDGEVRYDPGWLSLI